MSASVINANMTALAPQLLQHVTWLTSHPCVFSYLNISIYSYLMLLLTGTRQYQGLHSVTQRRQVRHPTVAHALSPRALSWLLVHHPVRCRVSPRVPARDSCSVLGWCHSTSIPSHLHVLRGLSRKVRVQHCPCRALVSTDVAPAEFWSRPFGTRVAARAPDVW